MSVQASPCLVVTYFYNRSRLNKLPGDELSFGNSVYSIRFDSKQEQPLYGHRYWFYLKDAVEDVPEYVVRWEEFEA
jgi:mRNA (guanine-N7-)-methyltransferase